MTDEPLTEVPLPAPADDEAPRKSLTIGAVCKALSQEFPDISISKIRYLEDQKLLTPRRTPGGYRLYAQSDVSRLRTILRLQRDEFLPLRVIRQELAAGRDGDRHARPPRAATPAPEVARPGAALRRLTFSIRDRGALYSLDDVVEETGAEPRWSRSSRTSGSSRASSAAARTYYDETEREIVRAVTELARYGVGGRNLRVFKTLVRARVGAAPADPRAVAALAEPRAPQGGDRGAREPGRRGLAPQAPAARARPAADRQVTDLAAHIRDIPDFPKPGIQFKDITPLLLDADALSRPSAGWRTGRGRWTSTSWWRPRRAGSSSAPRSPASSAPASCPRASRASCRTTRSRPSTSSSTASTRSRCTPTRSPTARACCCTTTCWPPAARPRRWPSWSRAPARRSPAARSSSSSPSCNGRQRLADYDVHTLLSYDE